MSHSLHRYGSKEDLKRDYVILAMPAKGVNEVGSAPSIKKHLEIIRDHNPVNMGGLRLGKSIEMDPDEIIDSVTDGTSTYNGVFTDRETVKEVIRDLIDEKVGLSTIISGNYEDSAWIAQELGIKTHTVNRSLGIWGKKELLPEPEILEIITQCGHGMISQHFVRDCFRRVKEGQDVHRVALEIGRLCHCAICNISRVEEILLKGLSEKER